MTFTGLVNYYTKNRVPSMRSVDGGDFYLTSPCNNADVDAKCMSIRKLLGEDSMAMYATPAAMNVVFEDDPEPVYAAVRLLPVFYLFF